MAAVAGRVRHHAGHHPVAGEDLDERRRRLEIEEFRHFRHQHEQLGRRDRGRFDARVTRPYHLTRGDIGAGIPGQLAYEPVAERELVNSSQRSCVPYQRFTLSARVTRFYMDMRAVAVLALCSCSGVPVGTAAAAATTTRPVATGTPLAMFVVPEETMEFQATLRGMHVAGVQTAIGKAGWVDGHNANHRQVARQDRGPRRVARRRRVGADHHDRSRSLDRDRGSRGSVGRARRQKGHDNSKHTWHEGDERQDVHSAVVALRGWRGAVGERTEMNVSVAGGHFPVALVNAGREKLEGRPPCATTATAHGEFHFSFWISDDLARVPLKFRTESVLGEIGIDLVDYQVPRDH